MQSDLHIVVRRLGCAERSAQLFDLSAQRIDTCTACTRLRKVPLELIDEFPDLVQIHGARGFRCAHCCLLHL